MGVAELVNHIEGLGLEPTRKEMFQVVRSLHKMVTNNQLQEYGTVLMFIDIELVASTLIVALLRLAYLKNHGISYWMSFLKSAEKELEQRGLDAQAILRGL